MGDRIRVCFLQTGYNAGPNGDRSLGKTTVLDFGQLHEKHDPGETIYCFIEVCVDQGLKDHLNANGLAMKQGTIIDDTLIAAHSSTLMRVTPECAGGVGARGAKGILRCTRPRKGTSGITASRKASLRDEVLIPLCQRA